MSRLICVCNVDRLLWFEADIVKRPYLRHCYKDFDIIIHQIKA